MRTPLELQSAPHHSLASATCQILRFQRVVARASDCNDDDEGLYRPNLHLGSRGIQPSHAEACLQPAAGRRHPGP